MNTCTLLIPKKKRWIQQRLESARGQYGFTADQKKHVLERLTAGEGLEKYLGTKYRRYQTFWS